MSYPHPEQTPMGWEPPTSSPSAGGDSPGFPSPPPPGAPSGPAGRRRRWPWILLGVVVLLALGIGGCTWFVFQATRPPIDAANEWLASVDEERWDDAYDALCQTTRQTLSRQEAVATLTEDFGVGVDDYRISQYQNSNGVVSVGGQVTVRGDDRPITLALSDDAGRWRVCGYTFDPLELGAPAGSPSGF